MHTLSMVFVAFVAIIHIYILVLEMFLWTKPRGMKVFRLTPERAEMTKQMAQNQGLYNGFLAAGLIWGMLAPPALGIPVAEFFAACVLVAGLYGAATVMWTILLVQSVPATLALVALFLGL
jgi:putative membrane protein